MGTEREKDRNISTAYQSGKNLDSLAS